MVLKNPGIVKLVGGYELFVMLDLGIFLKHFVKGFESCGNFGMSFL